MNTRDKVSEVLMDVSGIPTDIGKKIADSTINICWGLGSGILAVGVFSAAVEPLIVGGLLGGVAGYQIYKENFNFRPFAMAAALICGVGVVASSPFAKMPDIEAAPSALPKLVTPQHATVVPSRLASASLGGQ